ncbi:hypothetical protein [Flavivirga eckloniae]|nr:hypothetical protein [Flavivirga eckloniae]
MTQKLCVLCFTLIASCYTLSAQFITTWKTTTANERITIPTAPDETYNYTINWGMVIPPPTKKVMPSIVMLKRGHIQYLLQVISLEFIF